ncbi:MAG TPA: hypothetical protein PKL20_02365 [Candidatus Paceibacterota bacterium]|nr:hypothetical protein [Candidatus Paceibacterota bacterium]
MPKNTNTTPSKESKQKKINKKNTTEKKSAPILESNTEKKEQIIVTTEKETKPQIDSSIFFWSAEKNSNKNQRGLFWYLGIVVLAIILIIFAIIQKNYLFLAILILTLGVYYLINRQGAQEYFIKINNQDITIDEKKFPYEEILGFGYFEKLDKEYLVFETSSIAQKYILVPLKKDKDKIFEFLRKFVPEKQYEEDFLDTLEDFLKF